MSIGIRRAIAPAVILLSMGMAGACGGAPDQREELRVHFSKGDGSSPDGIIDWIENLWDTVECTAEFADPVHDAGLLLLAAAAKAGAITSRSDCDFLVNVNEIADVVISVVTEDPFGANAIDHCSCSIVFSGPGGTAKPTPPPVWHGWYGLGGQILGRPGVLQLGQNNQEVYVEGTNHKSWLKTWVGDHYVPAQDFAPLPDGNTISSEMAVVGWNGYRSLFMRNSNGALLQKEQINGVWKTVGKSLGGQIVGQPSAVVVDGYIDVYARGTDNNLWQIYSGDGGSTWSQWIPHYDGLPLASAPTVVARPGYRGVYMSGVSGAVFRKEYTTAKGWGIWQSLGGTVKGEVGVTMPTSTTIDLYVRGTNDELYQKWWDGSAWHPSSDGWVQHTDGTPITSSPTAVSWGSGYRGVYARSSIGEVIFKYWM